MVADRAGIKKPEYFGLERYASAPVEGWVFLNEGVIQDQGTLGKLRFRLKFFALDPDSLECEKVVEMMYSEVSLPSCLVCFSILPTFRTTLFLSYPPIPFSTLGTLYLWR